MTSWVLRSTLSCLFVLAVARRLRQKPPQGQVGEYIQIASVDARRVGGSGCGDDVLEPVEQRLFAANSEGEDKKGVLACVAEGMRR